MALFKNILLPVDFSINTEMEIKKAIELAQPGNAVIHLLYVISPFSISNFNHFAIPLDKSKSLNEIQKRLLQWKYMIEETLESVTTEIHLVKGMSIQSSIIKIAKQIGKPLIIIGDYKNTNFLNFFQTLYPNQIAKVTRCAVLTVRQGSFHNKIKTIVIPVRNFIPVRKIEMAVGLAKKFKARICLVTLASNKKDDNTEFANESFLQTFRMLKFNLDVVVDYHILIGNSLAKASLMFAKDIGADMILVNPFDETRVDSFSHTHINDLLSQYSRLQILAIEPYPNPEPFSIN